MATDNNSSVVDNGATDTNNTVDPTTNTETANVVDNTTNIDNTSAPTRGKSKSLRDERLEQEKAARDAKEAEMQLKRVQQVIESIKDVLAGKKLTQALIIRVVANCMVITSKMKVQNSVKKQVVIDALEKYIKENSDLEQDEIDLLMTCVDVTVSEAIDTIADIRKGVYSFKSCCF